MNSARRRLVFAGRFLGLLLLLYVVVAVNPVNDHVVVPFTAFVTRVSGVAVRLFDAEVRVSGTTMASPRFAIDVRNGCNAVEAMILFTAAVLAFPAPVRWRLAGLAIGLPVLQLVNVLRLTSLFWLGAWRPDLFNVVHIALWQSVIILIGVAMFVFWSSRSAARPAAVHP